MTQSTDHNSLAKPRSASLTELVAAPALPPEHTRLGTDVYVKIAILGALFVAINWWQFKLLGLTWYNDENWQHGWAIPLFSLYLVYARREQLLTAPRRGCLWGMPIILAGILMEVVGFYPLGVGYVQNLGMLFLLFGLVLYVAGPQVIKVTWLPIWYLLLAMPLPPMLYADLALPLQNIAAKCSTLFLQIFGINIYSISSSLHVTSRTGVDHGLEVAEACSGIKSLVGFLALGVAMAYLSDRMKWQRIVLVLAVLPVVVFWNIIRVSITVTMYYIDRPELGQKAMHSITGILIWVPVALTLWGISWVLNRVYVEEDDSQDPDQEEAPQS